MEKYILLLVDEIARLERAAEAAAYLEEHLSELVPPESDYWRRQVDKAVGCLHTILHMLYARLNELGLE